MTAAASVEDLRAMQARYPDNAHFAAVCAAQIAALDDPRQPTSLAPCEAAMLYRWAIGDGGRAIPEDTAEMVALGRALCFLIETAGDALAWEPVDVEASAIADPVRPAVALRPRPLCGEPGGLIFRPTCHAPRGVVAHRHPCPADGCPGVECFTTLEGCGDVREDGCPMEPRRGEPCPDLAARR